jgi:tRNA pseudouridine32 synthase/23S rRNA pseudouridine746 synthase
VQVQQVVLKAFSGQMTEDWHVPGWVGPVAGITASSPQYISYRRLTEQLSSRINSIQSTIKHHQLAAARQGTGAEGTAVSAKASKRKQKQRHHQARQQDPALQALQEHQSQLTAARKALSHELLLHIQDSYCTQDIKGRQLHLLDVYESYCHLSGEEPNHLIYAGASPRLKPAGAKGREWQEKQQHLLAKQQHHAESTASVSSERKVVSFPAGTGDCCAPKLIHAAIQAGLTPVGLVEFWYGAPPGEQRAAYWLAVMDWHQFKHCISAACCAGVHRAPANTLAVWLLSICALARRLACLPSTAA